MKPTKLSGNRENVLKQLRINASEQAIFTLYLNYAVNNISKIAKINVGDENKVSAALDNSADGREADKLYNKLVDFLWVFRDKEPQNAELAIRAFSNGQSLKDYVKKYVKTIFALRNYFVHTESKGIAPFVVDKNYFRFIEGVLAGAARENVMHSSSSNSKSQKLKLVIPRHDETNYEFTRKGLIFLVCLALYKDEAQEFCSMFPEMLEPTFEEEEKLKVGNRIVYGAEDKEKFKGLMGRGRSLSEFFTYFSYRRGRTSVEGENPDYISFADIVGDLNKVPACCYDYLSLDEERNMLKQEEEASTESEENKRFKYRLHKREKDRFLSQAAAYCEDFDVVKSIRFKKLDISSVEGRMKYYFGKEKDQENVVRQNRHYSIKKDAIGFEFIPQQSSSKVKIKALRSSMSSAQMKKLLAAHAAKVDVDAAINKYFSAYHRLFENLINETDIEAVNLYDEKYLKDISIIANVTPEALDDPDLANKYLSNSVLDFLCCSIEEKGSDDLSDALIRKLDCMAAHADDFLRRHKRFEKWVNETKPARDAMKKYRENVDKFRKEHPDERLPAELAEPPAEARIGGKPICKDLMYPPKDCNFTDADYVRQVFAYLNLFLPLDKRFRQLPLAEQHRGGVEDHLYQLVHAAIGKYSLDQNGLWHILEKFRKNELFGINAAPAQVLKKKMQKVSKKTLSALAVEATKLIVAECDNRCKRLESTELSKEELLMWSKHYGVKRGLSYTKDNLLKVVLGLDKEKWEHAYDYANMRPYKNRSLEVTEHIVSQVPFPNEFFDRLLDEVNIKIRKPSWEEWLKQWSPDKRLKLRGFYNVSPLINYTRDKSHSRTDVKVDTNATGVNISSYADFSRAGVDRAFRSIREFENRDKLLLFVALKYWERFKATETQTSAKENKQFIFNDIFDLRSFFTTKIMRDKENIKLFVYPNDLNKPMYPIIMKYLKDIVTLFPEKKESYDFYELVTAYREQLAKDRRVRLSMIARISIFGSICTIPRNKYEEIEAKFKDKKEQSAEIIKMEFVYYKTLFKDLSLEDYTEIVKLRNAIFHDGFILDGKKADMVLSRIGF